MIGFSGCTTSLSSTSRSEYATQANSSPRRRLDDDGHIPFINLALSGRKVIQLSAVFEFDYHYFCHNYSFISVRRAHVPRETIFGFVKKASAVVLLENFSHADFETLRKNAVEADLLFCLRKRLLAPKAERLGDNNR